MIYYIHFNSLQISRYLMNFKIILSFFLLSFAPFSLATAQDVLVSADDNNVQFQYIDSLIKNQKYDLANEKLDNLLKQNPDNVDALMLKGILIFSQDSLNVKLNSPWKSMDSIYDPNPEEESIESAHITKETAMKVSSYFLKALKVDPARMNVQYGLCFALAKGGLTDDLIARFPELKKYAKPEDYAQFSMSEYAKIIARHASVNEAMRVFDEIVKLYPDDGNVLSEIAIMYFENGQLNQSMKYVYLAEKKGHLDKSMLASFMLLHSIKGEYNATIKNASILSKLDHNQDKLLYRALKKRLDNKPGWEKILQKYLAHTKGKTDLSFFASSVLKLSESDRLEDFLDSFQFRIPAPLLVLNYEWGLKKYPNQFKLILEYADFLTYYYSYEKAIQLYRKIVDQKLIKNSAQEEDFNFYYAWALHRSGQVLKAQQYWKRLLDSSSFYKKSAASYFLGSYFFHKKDYPEARKYFSLVKDYPDKSKYAGFCQTMFNLTEN